MKKLFLLVLMATTLVACEKDELESAEETIIIMKENEKSKEEQPKQTTDWKLLNSKIIGAKDDAPQGKQSDYPKNKEN
jgi:hypothetical protein